MYVHRVTGQSGNNCLNRLPSEGRSESREFGPSLYDRPSVPFAANLEVVPVKSRIFLSKQFHEFPPLQPARRRSCAPFRRKENKKMLAYAALPLLTAKWAKNSHLHRQ